MRNHQSSGREMGTSACGRARRLLLGLVACAICAAAPLALPGCGSSTAPAPAAVPTDYALAQSWVTVPSASRAVDVFFVYPTTYNAPTGSLGPTWTAAWNVSVAQARLDTTIKTHVTSKAGVFARAGTNLYVPYYQQASGLDVLDALLYGSAPENAAAASAALQVAYADVANAFDYYLAHFNKDASGNPRPFILAGHSQGSNLLLMLLQDKFSDPALRAQLVAAYVVGWSITAEDLAGSPAALQQVGVCGLPASRTAGCIVTYNTQAYPGAWTQEPGTPKYGIVKPNAYCVNPLTWVATGPGGVESPAADPASNLGAIFYSGQLGSTPPVSYAPDALGDDRFEIAAYTGAQCSGGGLVVDAAALPTPATHANLAPPYDQLPMFHNYDYDFFYRNLEQDSARRIEAHGSR